MRLRDQIAVEPLDEARAARIEHAVVAAYRADPPRAGVGSSGRRTLVLTLTAAAAAAALTFVAMRDRSAPPPAAATIATDADSSTLNLGDAMVHSRAGTAFRVTRPSGGVLIELARGKVELEVAPRKQRPPLVVRADDVEVEVVGTEFSVERGDDVVVEVREGVVKVARGGERTRLAAGQRWSRSDGAVASAELPVAKAKLPVAGAELPVASAELPVASAELPVAPSSPLPTPPAARGEGRDLLPDLPTSPRAGGKGSPRAVQVGGDLRAAIRAVPLGSMLEVAGTPAERMARYRQISVEDRRDEASAALYSLARVQHDQGQHQEAVRTLDAHLRRFPSAREREAVKWLRLRVLCGRDFDEVCRAAAHSYRDAFPGTDRAKLADRVTVAQ